MLEESGFNAEKHLCYMCSAYPVCEINRFLERNYARSVTISQCKYFKREEE